MYVGKITVRFTSQTTSASLYDAMELSKKHEHHIKNNFCFVHFEKADDDLEKLLSIVKAWRTTKTFLEDQEIDKLLLFKTFFCKDKKLCGGLCTHPLVGFLNLSSILEKIRIKKGVGFAYEWGIKPLKAFLEKTGDKEFKLNKEKLLDYIKNEYSFELENCQIINTEKTLGLVEEIPDKIIVEEPDSFLDEDSDQDIDEMSYSESIDPEDYEEIAEIFADAFEKRLRKVFKEFYNGKK